MTPKEKQAKDVEEMNARVGYDIPLTFATLNTIVINTERKMGEIPLIEKRTAMAVVCEEYSMSEMDGQYLMHPYFAFRFKGKIVCNSGCVGN